MTQGSTDLFRSEMLEARRVRLEGEVLLLRPLRAHAVVALLCTFAFALVIWVATGRYARIEPTRGILATTISSTKVIALRPGVVARLEVREGQRVRAGQTLAVVQVDTQYENGSRAAQEEVSAIASQQGLAIRQMDSSQQAARSERAALEAALADAQQQYSDVEGQVGLQTQVVRQIEEVLSRYRSVAEKGFITKNEIERRELELLAAKQALARLRQQLTGLKGEQGRAEAGLSKSQADESVQTANMASVAEGLRLQLARARSSQTYVLAAPVDGVVTALQTAVGRTVEQTVPLMFIVPNDATVHAELYAPSKAIGFTKPGDEVRLMYDAFPYERFGSFPGRVRSISRVALDPRQIDVPLKVEEPVYRITVQPMRQTVSGYGDRMKLQPGMTLMANIVLERRSFLDWLLAPISAVTNRDR